MFNSQLYLSALTILIAMISGSHLNGDTEILNPMEVSALRLETSPKNLNARVQLIDQAKIAKSGATDIVGLLRKEANLQVRSTSEVA